MLTLQYLRNHTDEAIARLAKRGNSEIEALIYKALDHDRHRRSVMTDLENFQAQMNKASKSIGALMQKGAKEEAEQSKQEVAELKQRIQDLKSALSQLDTELTHTLYLIPNTPSENVPFGRSADDNLEVDKGGTIPDLGEEALPHWELAAKHALIDFEMGVKVTGAGFPFYLGEGAKLQRSLIQFFLDEASHAGYVEVMPPLVVNEDSGLGTGQLPDKEGQMYHVTEDDLYLIPTAEVPITNMYRDLILEEDQLPIKHCGYTPCFRREAGSYGKDVRGLNRLHQFDKVELVEIAHPDHSYDILDRMVAHVKGLLEKLDLPYRVLQLCGGDMGFTSAMTYDFEVYSAAQGMWLEVSSVSNFEAFQSNRLKCRFRRNGEKQTELVHTLNGSALALPRIMAALLENNQDGNGIDIPQALHRYTGFSRIGH